MQTQPKSHDSAHAYPFWKRRFFTIWSGQAVFILGSSIAQFAIVWYLTQETGSATVLAIASFFGILPGVILSPFAGALVDRNDRRWIMILADHFFTNLDPIAFR